MSHIQQHNLHLTYREILSKPDKTNRLSAFADLLEELSGEELDYVDGLMERDIIELLPDECLERVEGLLHLRLTQETKTKRRSTLR